MKYAQVESPFGPMEITFIRNNRCVLGTTGHEYPYITVNNVKIMFQKFFAIVDEKWSMIRSPCSKEICDAGDINEVINLKFYDWTRKGSISSSVHQKLSDWMKDVFVLTLNSNVYQTECRMAERIHIRNLVIDMQVRRSQINDSLLELENKICELNAKYSELSI